MATQKKIQGVSQYQIQPSDNGKHLLIYGDVTIIVQTTGFTPEATIDITSMGGKVNFISGNTAIIRSFNGELKLAGPYATSSLERVDSSNEWLFYGNTIK